MSIQQLLCQLRRALKDVFGEAVMARDMPEPCEFLSLDSCQKRFIGAHTEVDLAPHLVVGLVLQVGDADTWYRKPGSFFQS